MGADVQGTVGHGKDLVLTVRLEPWEPFGREGMQLDLSLHRILLAAMGSWIRLEEVEVGRSGGMLVGLVGRAHRIYRGVTNTSKISVINKGEVGGAKPEVRKAVGRASTGGKTHVSFGRVGFRCLLGTARELGGHHRDQG